jgi:hypothetical protein
MKTVDIIGYNYLGPYVSGGKFQKSVKNSLVKPVDRLDADARVHDIAYATYDDFGHRLAADVLFCRYAGISKMAKFAKTAVMVGNSFSRMSLLEPTHSRYLHYLENEEAYVRDIEKLYEKDLYWSEFNAVGVKEMKDLQDSNLRGVNSVVSAEELGTPNEGFALRRQAPVLSKSTPKETLTTYSQPREAPRMVVSEIEPSGEAKASTEVDGSVETPQVCYVGEETESGKIENASEKPTTSGVNNVQYCDSDNCNNRSIAQIGAPRSVYYFQSTQYSKKKRKRRRKKKYVFL